MRIEGWFTLATCIAIFVAAAVVEASWQVVTPIYGTMGATLPIPTVWAWSLAYYECHWLVAITLVVVLAISRLKIHDPVLRPQIAHGCTIGALVLFVLWPYLFLSPLWYFGNTVHSSSDGPAPAPTYLELRAKVARGHEVVAKVACTNDRQFVSWSSNAVGGWGSGLNPINSIQVVLDSAHVDVPTSAFIGLSSPHDVAITSGPDTFALHIIGGDAASSYEAVYEFTYTIDAALLGSRAIRHGEFPDERYEKTRYSYIADDGR